MYLLIHFIYPFIFLWRRLCRIRWCSLFRKSFLTKLWSRRASKYMTDLESVCIDFHPWQKLFSYITTGDVEFFGLNLLFCPLSRGTLLIKIRCTTFAGYGLNYFKHHKFKHQIEFQSPFLSSTRNGECWFKTLTYNGLKVKVRIFFTNWMRSMEIFFVSTNRWSFDLHLSVY